MGHAARSRVAVHRSVLVVLVLSIAALGLSDRARGETVVVNGNDSGPGSLRQAIIDAPVNDTITFAAGVSPALTSAPITIDKNLTISGSPTTISGSGLTSIFRVTNNAEVALDALELIDGRGSAGASAEAPGAPGAIFTEAGTGLTVSNSTLSDNTGGNGGAGGTSSGDGGAGAIANAGGLTLTNTTLSNNAGGSGAVGVGSGGGGAGGPGAVSSTGPLTMTNTTMTNNTGGPAGQGGAGAKHGGAGAIFSNAGALTVAGSRISANTGGNGASFTQASGTGGGPGGAGAVHVVGAASTITLSTLADNTGGNGGAGDNAAGDGGAGGIRNDLGALEVIGSTLSGNAGGDGSGPGSSGGQGGIAASQSAVEVNYSTVSRNVGGDGSEQADIAGQTGTGGTGGASNAEGSVRIANATFFGNRGGSGAEPGAGAALAGHAATLTVLNATIAGNTGAAGGAGAIDAAPASGGDPAAAVTVGNAILAGNGPSNCRGPVTGDADSVAFPLGGCPATFVEADPKLGPLANYGGPTQTMILLPGSSAIDLIPAPGGVCAATPTDDQRLEPRPAGPGCDAGAFERQPDDPTSVGGGVGGPGPGPGGPGGASDTTAPETSITSGPDKTKSSGAAQGKHRRGRGLPSTRDRTPGFSFTSSEPNSTFQCSIDGGTFTPCALPYSVPAKLKRGESHTFAVRAVDTAGNVDQTPASIDFKVKKKG